MLQSHLQLLIIDLSSKLVLVFDDYRLNSDRPNEGRLDILRNTQCSETQRFTVGLLGNQFLNANLRKTNLLPVQI